MRTIAKYAMRKILFLIAKRSMRRMQKEDQGLEKGKIALSAIVNKKDIQSAIVNKTSDDTLDVWHNYFNVPPIFHWRINDDGVYIRDSHGRILFPRSSGEPKTVRAVWNKYRGYIFHWCDKLDVPVELIIATIATESKGLLDAIRYEPGFVSILNTPDRVSIGLMQPLISTAQKIVGQDAAQTVTAEWLSDPMNNIFIGVSYIQKQSAVTNYDPPLVAAAYNSGGLYLDIGRKNPWHLRSYPIGTGRHISRFVQWYNDSKYVLSG